MIYRCAGLVVNAANAAKSSRQASSWLLSKIDRLDPSGDILDYGCGKFRYTAALSTRAASVTAVDSTIQITRTQIIHGLRTSLFEYARAHLPNVRVVSEEQIEWRNRKYSHAFVINVLSAIPDRGRRILDRRQLLLPVVLPHLGMLPGCLTGFAPGTMPEHQAPGLPAAPLLDPPLQGSQLPG
jgi:hypothetical protein